MRPRSPVLLCLVLACAVAYAAQASPVGADAVITSVSAPGSRNAPREVVTAQLSTTPTAVWTDQLSASGPTTKVFGGRYANDAITQNILVADGDGSINICVKAFSIFAVHDPVDTTNDTCAKVCAASPASAMTCDRAHTTEGQWVSPGAPQPLRDTTAFCYCWRSASGAPWAQSVRIAR